MPFTLQSSGDKGFVKSQVNGQIEGSYNLAPKGQDREDNKARMEKIRDYLFDDLGGDFPNESPVGLVLVGDAGKDYISITQMQFSISRPPKEADTDSHPAPDKKEVAPETMVPPAPDKKVVGEGNTSASELAKSVTPSADSQPTTASPNFTGKSDLNPTAPSTEKW